MMRRYPAYKDSGEEWLGEVPEGWEVIRLRHIATLRTEKATTAENPIALENIESWSGRIVPSDTEFSGEGVAFEAGDILFGKLRPYLAKVAVADQPGEAVGDFHVLRPLEKVDCLFLQRQLLTPALISVIDGSTYGSKMPRASWDFMADLRLALPPPAEQTAIAAFLDRETAKIDALVAEQRRLINLLREKRQAVISHAVTKGLNPNAPLKPSGIDWLGDVPEGWEVVRLRHVATLNPSKSEIGHVPGETEVSFLPMEAVGENGELDLERTRPLSEVLNGYTYFADGDVTYAKITPCFENGKGARMRGLIQGFGFGTTELTVLRPDRKRIVPEFLNCVLSSPIFRLIAEGAMYGAGGQKRVPDDFARDFIIGLPSLEEQREVVAAIDKAKLKFDSLTATAEAAIPLMQERRAALISAAVTGKIDVRHLSPAATEAA
jgi:type I restriction enzyme S subunit